MFPYTNNINTYTHITNKIKIDDMFTNKILLNLLAIAITIALWHIKLSIQLKPKT